MKAVDDVHQLAIVLERLRSKMCCSTVGYMNPFNQLYCTACITAELGHAHAPYVEHEVVTGILRIPACRQCKTTLGQVNRGDNCKECILEQWRAYTMPPMPYWTTNNRALPVITRNPAQTNIVNPSAEVSTGACNGYPNCPLVPGSSNTGQNYPGPMIENITNNNAPNCANYNPREQPTAHVQTTTATTSTTESISSETLS